MLRGQEDEVYAKAFYAEKYAPVQEIGFITNDEWGFTLGYSPDGLVGADGLIECKSRCQKFQAEILINGTVPDDHMIQIQAGLLVSRRRWLDYISYCGGMPMVTIRVLPDPRVQDAILTAATAFERRLSEKMDAYRAAVGSTSMRLVPTERRVEQEIRI